MGGCVVIARNRRRSKRELIDAGDGGLFAVIGLFALEFMALLTIAGHLGRWYGADAAEVTFELGLAVIVIAALGRIMRGGRR